MSQDILKGKLLQVIEAIKENGEAAKAQFRAQTSLVENLRCEGRIRDFEKLTIDEPNEVGGGNAGPNPIELGLVALGTCQKIMYAAYAAVMGIPLDEVKIDVRGDLDFRGLFGMDESIPSGYTKIEYKTTIKSPADEETIRKLVEVVESHCPILDSFTRPVEVAGTVEINGVEAAATV